MGEVSGKGEKREGREGGSRGAGGRHRGFSLLVATDGGTSFLMTPVCVQKGGVSGALSTTTFVCVFI